MIPLSRKEAIGIFVSVAVMALVLAGIRFGGDTVISDAAPESNTQVGGIIVAGEGETAVRDALLEAVGSNGSLEKMVVDDILIGVGAEVQEGDRVTVHYIGATPDGIEFDNSYKRGEPFVFIVGQGRVIPGWEQGIIGMKIEGQRTLVIPPGLAYGDRAVGPIEAGTPLVFTIELLAIE